MTRTGEHWEIIHGQELSEAIEAALRRPFFTPPNYEYLVYLRQLGFSSPLLDWTASPYIAAYFAFADTAEDRNEVAIFVYDEMPTGVKVWSEGDPQVQATGPYIRSIPRHFSQQSWYTIGVNPLARPATFCRHAMVLGRNDRTQDVLTKLTIPYTERIAALRFLDAVNINHYTLFHTPDALVRSMDMLAFDEIGR